MNFFLACTHFKQVQIHFIHLSSSLFIFLKFSVRSRGSKSNTVLFLCFYVRFFIFNQIGESYIDEFIHLFLRHSHQKRCTFVVQWRPLKFSFVYSCNLIGYIYNYSQYSANRTTAYIPISIQSNLVAVQALPLVVIIAWYIIIYVSLLSKCFVDIYFLFCVVSLCLCTQE